MNASGCNKSHSVMKHTTHWNNWTITTLLLYGLSPPGRSDERALVQRGFSSEN